MSSGTRSNPGAVNASISELGDAIGGSGPTMKLSERQQALDILYRYYRTTNYEGRKTDWDGRPAMDKIETDFVATSGAIPAGFYDAGQTAEVPLRFRKPSAPFYMARVIVRRFTSLLFSQKRHPKINCDDPRTEDWLNGFAEQTRLWAQMQMARNYGGAMGSVCVGAKIVDSKPFVEVHDPRWCHPQFSDRDELTISVLEKRYQFSEEILDPLTGERVEVWFWYRRVIDEKTDTVWPRVAVQTSEEPDWEREDFERVEHNFGFTPVVWIQNMPVQDAVDGDPDCLGIFDTVEQIDRLWSQAARGTVANCDPTLKIASDAEFSNIRKGSGNALQVERGADIGYLEMTGGGIESAMTIAEKLEDRACMIARVELKTNFDGPARTEEEVEKNYSNMIEQADEFREQYGERGVKKLLEMVLRIARASERTWIDRSNPDVPTLSRSSIKLPKKRVQDEMTGAVVWQTREIGSGEQIELSWPQYFQASLKAVSDAVTAAVTAKQGSLISGETATKFVAEYFQVEDVKAETEAAAVEAEVAAAQFAEQSAMASGFGSDPNKPKQLGSGDKPKPEKAPKSVYG